MLRNEARTGIREDKTKGDNWQGNICFEKIVTLSTSLTLTVPASFVHEHADKVQKFVILQSEADGQLWTVEVEVYFPHGRPQVVFNGGWKEFSVFNGLVKGDRLTFTLVAKSEFTVSILRSSDNSKELRPSLQEKKPRLEESHGQPKKSLRPQFIDLTDDKPERDELSAGLFAKEGALQSKSFAHSNAAADSSLSSSDMDSHFFEPVQVASPPSKLYPGLSTHINAA